MLYEVITSIEMGGTYQLGDARSQATWRHEMGHAIDNRLGLAAGQSGNTYRSLHDDFQAAMLANLNTQRTLYFESSIILMMKYSMLGMTTVITSYSIHYTKLYEAAAPSRRPAARLASAGTVLST